MKWDVAAIFIPIAGALWLYYVDKDVLDAFFLLAVVATMWIGYLVASLIGLARLIRKEGRAQGS